MHKNKISHFWIQTIFLRESHFIYLSYPHICLGKCNPSPVELSPSCNMPLPQSPLRTCNNILHSMNWRSYLHQLVDMLCMCMVDKKSNKEILYDTVHSVVLCAEECALAVLNLYWQYWHERNYWKNVVIQMLNVSAHLYSITVYSHNPFFGKICITSSLVQLFLAAKTQLYKS